MKKIPIKLLLLERETGKRTVQRPAGALMEFHIDRDVRREYGLHGSLFAFTGNLVLADLRQTRELAAKFNAKVDPAHPERFIRAGELFAMGLIDEILHYVVALYRRQVQPDAFDTCLERLETKLGESRTETLLHSFSGQFPPRPVYMGEKGIAEYLESDDAGESCRALSLEETLFLSLENMNPAFKPFKFLFNDNELAERTVYPAAIEEIKAHLKSLPTFGPDGINLWDMLRAPAIASPNSLLGQLEYMRKHWGFLISKFLSRILIGLDVIKEEEKPVFFGPGPTVVLDFSGMDEYERFSPDQAWMPQTVLIAKSTLVWLYQLSKKYGRDIGRLDQIPDEELDELARRGFTGLWLIGLWERSRASRTIKQWAGNPEAAASAYSLYDYDIAGELGGWGALNHLRERCIKRGIRLGSDMVPNHTGIDSRWLIEHPDRFLQLPHPPFPGYNYNCGNLSGRDDVTVQIEEHYFTRSDAAVVFKRIDNRTGETRYIYHGNDGTSMPWNDTAQIDFLNPEAREAVIRTIIGVCQQFSIVRFDAAMTLAKRHIQRLWYPTPGHGGAIASRAEHSISNEEFNRRIPNEFWREVVDRCAAEAPNTLLLAEAFWMMEGYFVRTLGMHRVYNSAFMNMLKNEENAKYRATVKNTLEFDPEILKRFVNFMNNPDEETAVAQFGKGDKYFGICTLLVTMPGLPMFGHGQIEGFEEKYGMEYRRAYRDEQQDGYLVDRHEREIFPLMKKRYLFSGSANFRLFDMYSSGIVNENVFAYSNRSGGTHGEERTLVFYNNSYYECSGWIKQSDPAIPSGNGRKTRDDLCTALALHRDGAYFTFLKEQRSGLWFIRSSKDISENGFFVSLKGYEAQVFLDIYEVADDEKGRWARLNNDLNGKGVQDPESAIMDIFLGELYYRFTELIKPQNAALLPNNAGLLKKQAEAFFQTASRFLSGADGMYEPWIPGGKTAVGGKHVYPPFDMEKIWGEFSARAARIASCNVMAVSHNAEQVSHNAVMSGNGGVVTVSALAYAALASLQVMICGVEGSPSSEGAPSVEGAPSIEASCPWGMQLVSLAFDHWQLDRRMRDVLQGCGASAAEAWQVTRIMRAFLQRLPPQTPNMPAHEKGFNPRRFAGWLIEDNYSTDDFRTLLGINLFNDESWFNKEGFEAALFYGSLFAAVETGMADRVTQVCNIFLQAEAGSGYRLDRFIDLLENEDSGQSIRTLEKSTKGKKK